MHIPDGYLSPQTYIPLYGAAFGILSVALRRLKKGLDAKHIPYLAMAAAFSFLVMMFNIPIPGGTTGHAVGAAVVSILLGPWTSIAAISVVLIIQAVVFGDGGITAIGANCFNMAVIMSFVSYGVFRLASGCSGNKSRIYTAAFLSGYAGLSVSALMTALELGIQPLIARAADGRPLYAPYPLSVAVPAMLFGHLGFFSIVEGTVTAVILRYFMKYDPELVCGSSSAGVADEKVS